MSSHALTLLIAASYFISAHGHAYAVTPGKVFPNYPQTWDMHNSTIAMICNASGPVDPSIGAKWGLTDLGERGGRARAVSAPALCDGGCAVSTP